MTDKRSETPRDQNLPNELWQKTCMLVPQILVCGALVYSFFFAGGVAIATQYHVCLLLVVAIVVFLLSPVQPTFRRPRTILVLFSALSVWLFFTAFQSVLLPEGLVKWLSPSTANLRTQFSGTVPLAQWQSISLVPSVSRLAWPKYAIGFAFFLMGTCLWQTRESRSALLLVVSASGVVLAIWGVSSKVTGSAEPTAFASIGYKNAAASLLIASIATSLGLLLVTLRPALRSSQSKRKKSRSKREKYKNETNRTRASKSSGEKDNSLRTVSTPSQDEPKLSRPVIAAVLAGMLVLLIGLIWTQSHLAWIAAFVPVAAWAFTMRKFIALKTAIAIIVATVLISTVAIFVSGMLSPAAGDFQHSQVVDTKSQFDQWNDTWDQVVEFPVFGVGLGAYGYAQLPYANEDGTQWFYHAHNQPLEWTLESGLAGLLLLLIASLAILFILAKLYKKRKQGTTLLIWFTVGVVSLLGITIQSFFDYAVLTPVVLWTYALLLGVMVNIRRDSQSDRYQSRSRARKTDDELERTSWERFTEFASLKFSRPFTWTLIAAVMLLLGQRWLQEEILDNAILQSTQLPASVKPPTKTQLDHAKKKLSARAKSHSINGQLWQRLAAWDIAAFRLNLIAANKKRNIDLTWPTTTPQQMFKTYHAMNAEEKNAANESWIFDEIQQGAVDDAKKHFVKSLQCNPLSAQAHHQLALISPLCQNDFDVHGKFSRDLSPIDGDLQRENGAMAMYLGDTETMIDQWRKSVRNAPENVRQIIALSSQVLSPKDIADKVMCDLRSDVWISVVRSSYREEQLQPFQEPFLQAARSSVRGDDDLEDGTRHFYLAQLADFEGDQETAIHQFREAVNVAPANADFRYRMAVELTEQAEFLEAREAVSIGRTLEPGSERWPQLLERLNELSPATKP